MATVQTIAQHLYSLCFLSPKFTFMEVNIGMLRDYCLAVQDVTNILDFWIDLFIAIPSQKKPSRQKMVNQ